MRFFYPLKLVPQMISYLLYLKTGVLFAFTDEQKLSTAIHVYLFHLCNKSITTLISTLPWQIPSFPQPPCDDCPPGRPKRCRGAQQFSGWTHPAGLAPGFSAAAGWRECTGTLAPLEYWSYTESSSSSSGPGVGGTEMMGGRGVTTQNKSEERQTGLKAELIWILHAT